MKTITLTLIFTIITGNVFSQSGSITNINPAQRTDGSMIIDITYDLAGPEPDYYITVEASFDGGVNFNPADSVSGDAGADIVPGTGKHIEWIFGAEYPGTYSDQTQIRLTASFSSCGEPCPGMPTVTDIDGNQYNTVLIGNQCWMKENLKTTTYRNGTAIPNVTDANAWSNLTTGAYVWYVNDISWKDKYGALYNWFTTVDPNGLCPTGWHVPTHGEWTALTDYIGGTSSPHGNELKSCRQVNSPLGGGCNTSEHPRWNEHGTHYGTDDYGFSGLPGGGRNYDGYFYYVGDYGIWWSSTEYSSSSAWGRRLGYTNGGVYVNGGYKRRGFSVRCLRDFVRTED